MNTSRHNRSSLGAQLRSSLSRYRAGASSRIRPSAAGKDAVAALRDTWSRYPRDWRSNPKLNMGVTTLGDEWGGPEFADHIVDLVSDELGPDRDVLELGCGGGKFSQRLAPRCRSLLCTDISPAMIDHTRSSLAQRGVGGNVSYRVLNGVDFEGLPAGSVDFIFSYDVMLHLQPQNVFSYLLDARRVLRDNGSIMLHQINLASTGGVRHFLGQYAAGSWKRDFGDLRRRGHIYYMSEDQMCVLAEEAGLVMGRFVSDHGEFEYATHGRDLIGFLRKRRSRLDGLARERVDLVQLEGDETVYAIVDGRRHAFGSANQFERDGFDWTRIRVIDESEISALPDGGPLQRWE